MKDEINAVREYDGYCVLKVSKVEGDSNSVQIAIMDSIEYHDIIVNKEELLNLFKEIA